MHWGVFQAAASIDVEPLQCAAPQALQKQTKRRCESGRRRVSNRLRDRKLGLGVRGGAVRTDATLCLDVLLGLRLNKAEVSVGFWGGWARGSRQDQAREGVGEGPWPTQAAPSTPSEGGRHGVRGYHRVALGIVRHIWAVKTPSRTVLLAAFLLGVGTKKKRGSFHGLA